MKARLYVVCLGVQDVPETYLRETVTKCGRSKREQLEQYTETGGCRVRQQAPHRYTPRNDCDALHISRMRSSCPLLLPASSLSAFSTLVHSSFIRARVLSLSLLPAHSLHLLSVCTHWICALDACHIELLATPSLPMSSCQLRPHKKQRTKASTIMRYRVFFYETCLIGKPFIRLKQVLQGPQILVL